MPEKTPVGMFGETIAKPELEHNLQPIPGDTYVLREELKALGAVWDNAKRVWRIAPDKLPLATALVEHQTLLPTASKSAEDGATYGAKEALKVVGARWDKVNRAWTIREDRATYARAVLAAISTAVPPPGAIADSPAVEKSTGEGAQHAQGVTQGVTRRLPEEGSAAQRKTGPRRVEKDETAANTATAANRERAGLVSTELSGAASGRILLGELWVQRNEAGLLPDRDAVGNCAGADRAQRGQERRQPVLALAVPDPPPPRAQEITIITNAHLNRLPGLAVRPCRFS
jgi:hypothetical protein